MDEEQTQTPEEGTVEETSEVEKPEQRLEPKRGTITQKNQRYSTLENGP
jgi:hypothetical protein